MRNYIAICYKAEGTVLEQDCNKLTPFPDSLFLKENFDHHVLHTMEMLSLSNIEHKKKINVVGYLHVYQLFFERLHRINQLLSFYTTSSSPSVSQAN